MMIRCVCWAAVLALLVPVSLAQGGDKKVTEFKGELKDTDPKDALRKTSPHKVHEFKMKAGETVLIRMSSTEIDSYLRVEDSSKKPLAEDDDGDGFPNAKLVFKAPKDDTY